MHVGNLMTRDPSTCGSGDSLDRAAQIMWEKDCGCVPVVDANKKPVAMITDRDVCMAAYTRGQPLSNIAVSATASRGVVVVREDDSLEAAEKLMQSYHVRRLPVVDRNGHLVGVLSMSDLARHVSIGHRHGDLNADRIVRTLAAVCEPPPQIATAH